MNYTTIEREIRIEAAPDVVYEVISTPEHLRQWWPDDAELEPVPGASGVVTFAEGSNPHAHVVPLTVEEADPPRRFSFRWVYDDGAIATPTNSLLVTFDLVPSGSGTLLRFSETGFRGRGWEEAVLEAHYRDHSNGWDHFLPRLVTYIARLTSAP